MSEASVQRVIDAWTNHKGNPIYHKAGQDQLRLAWPTLGRALDALVSPSEEVEDIETKRREIKTAYAGKSDAWKQRVDDLTDKEVLKMYDRLNVSEKL